MCRRVASYIRRYVSSELHCIYLEVEDVSPRQSCVGMVVYIGDLLANPGVFGGIV